MPVNVEKSNVIRVRRNKNMILNINLHGMRMEVDSFSYSRVSIYIDGVCIKNETKDSLSEGERES